MKKIDIKKQNNSFKEFTGQTFDIHDLEIAQPDNKEKHEERQKNIQNICNKLLNVKITNTEDYIHNVTEYGQKIKENIIYETFNYPERFIKIEEMKNVKEGSKELIEGALAQLLSQNNITYAIEKKNK